MSTQVNIINDSSERIKIKVDNGKDNWRDEIINIEPGENVITSGTQFADSDVTIDIIINPVGPNNNERLGAFKFNNPLLGRSNVKSGDFCYIGRATVHDSTGIGYGTDNTYRRGLNRGPKTYWAKREKLEQYLGTLRTDATPPNRTNITDTKDKLFSKIREWYSEAPRPIFTLESFEGENWDLRIAGDNFLPGANDFWLS